MSTEGSNVTQSNTGPSWDAASTGAPHRPALGVNLSEEVHVARPTRIVVGFVLVALAVIGFLAITTSAALRFDGIREATIAALPDDLTHDYTNGELVRAVQVMLAAIGGLGLVLALMQLLSASALMVNRSATGRGVLIVATVLYFPVAFVSIVVMQGNAIETGVSGAIGVCLLAAVVLVCTPRASLWLRQSEKRKPIPLVAPEPAVQ